MSISVTAILSVVLPVLAATVLAALLMSLLALFGPRTSGQNRLPRR